MTRKGERHLISFERKLWREEASRAEGQTNVSGQEEREGIARL